MTLTNNSEITPPGPPPALESGQQAVRTLFRNSTFFLGTDAVIKLLSFIFNIYVVRQLGDARFGFYSTALAYAGIFSIIGDLGMTQYAVREIARGRRQADEMFWDLVCVRLILSVIATIFITASAYYAAGYQMEMVVGIFWVCLGFFLHAFFGPINIILTGRERIDYASVLNTIIQVFFVTVGTWVLIKGYSFYSLIVASYIGVPVAAIMGAVYIKRLKMATFRVQITPKSWLPLLKYSLPFAMITFTLVAATDLDTVLISLWRNPAEVGWYKAAYNLIFKLLFIKGALLATLTPQMSRYYGVSKDRLDKTFNSSFKILWASSFPIAVGVTLLATPLIQWLYTAEFTRSSLVLAILIWALPALNLSSLYGSIATAADKEKAAARVYAASALTNLAVNLVAVPLWGYIGAAVSTVITELVVVGLFYAILHHEFPLTDLTNTLLKPLAAGLVMGGVIFILPAWPLALVVASGASVYLVGLFALKPFNQAEVAVLGSLWLSLYRRLRRPAAS
jgi:O-antigen/teichoic acid export membrane protein